MELLGKRAYSYIRFSKPTQIKGDSLRRQLEESEKFVKENGLILDTKYSFKDLGLSAYYGTHRTRGALGSFLRLVSEGKIEKGSVLLVENLDRLSREEVVEALSQFTSIISAGITIVTLTDGMIYNSDSIRNNWTQLILSITYMARAHEESDRKSKNLKKAWQTKRKSISESSKLTAICPAWLTPIKEITGDGKIKVIRFEPIPGAVDVLNLIYDRKLSGYSVYRIAKELNQMSDLNGIPVWKPKGRKNKRGSWRASYISKLLHNNMELLGEYQPYTLIEGKRTILGEPIKDYFPKVISEEKYYRVQNLIKTNLETRGFAGGRNDKMNNLFGHMAVCMHCGYPMQFQNKGYGSKGGQYLICDKELRKVDGGCLAKKIHYKLVEETILNYCLGLDVTDLLPEKIKHEAELQSLMSQEQAVKGELKDIEEKVKKLLDKVESKGISKEYERSLDHRIEAFLLRKEKLIDQQKQLKKDIDKIKISPKNTEEQIKNIQELIDRMRVLKNEEKADDLLNMRLSLRSQLRHLIKKVLIHQGGLFLGILFHSGQRRTIFFDREKEKIWDMLPGSDKTIKW